MAKNKFSIKKRLKSFKYAFSGLLLFLKTEHNAWIHIFAALMAISFGIALKISTIEWLFLVVAIASVLSAEAFNTAIEKLTDMAKPSYNDIAGVIKDISAGAVLIVAIAALVTGLVIFLPKIIQLFLIAS